MPDINLAVTFKYALIACSKNKPFIVTRISLHTRELHIDLYQHFCFAEGTGDGSFICFWPSFFPFCFSFFADFVVVVTTSALFAARLLLVLILTD